MIKLEVTIGIFFTLIFVAALAVGAFVPQYKEICVLVALAAVLVPLIMAWVWKKFIHYLRFMMRLEIYGAHLRNGGHHTESQIQQRLEEAERQYKS